MNIQGPGSPLARIAPLSTPVRPAAQAPKASEAAPTAQEAFFEHLLTPEEREFFAQLSSLGTLSYGPRTARPAATAGPLGQRIDVRG